MIEPDLAPMRSWLVAALDEQVSQAIRRLRRAPDVRHVAVMPDVHLAEDVCVGVAVATVDLLSPQAVGGDIGCGMLAVPFDVEAALLRGPQVAGRVLRRLSELVPARRRHRRRVVAVPDDLAAPVLSDSRLEALWRGVGTLEFATIGSGNHFVELQADESDRLWLMVHSGSRGLGPAIRDHHHDALCSSAHGAGRILSRTEARGSITSRELQRQMGDVWYDVYQADRLRDEAPGAYKDIRAVARAQRELVKVVRVLRPVLNYKGT